MVFGPNDYQLIEKIFIGLFSSEINLKPQHIYSSNREALSRRGFKVCNESFWFQLTNYKEIAFKNTEL